MTINPEFARKVAFECEDPEVAHVIYSLVSEVEASGKREVELEEGLLDLQLRLSVLLTTLARVKKEPKSVETQPQMRGPEIKVVYVDELAKQRVVNELFDKYVFKRTLVTDGPIDIKGVDKDGMTVDGTV